MFIRSYRVVWNLALVYLSALNFIARRWWADIFGFQSPGICVFSPFDSSCVLLSASCLWASRWLWCYDDNTLWGCPESIKYKYKCLPPISTGYFKGWYWLFYPFLSFRGPDERDSLRNGGMIMQLLGGSLCGAGTNARGERKLNFQHKRMYYHNLGQQSGA